MLALGLAAMATLGSTCVALGKASHDGWPRINGLLMMNSRDQSRPLNGHPARHNELLGGHGSDTIHAGRWGDVIWGDYKPCCQPTSQHDRLFGGDGPDFIYPSHGRNDIKAGAGTDIIHGHFGHGTIDCGPGRDMVYVHGGHRHAYRLKGCEVISTATGQSAPKWVLRKLPWNVCPK